MLTDDGNMRGVAEVNADRNERIPLVFTCKPESQKRSTENSILIEYPTVATLNIQNQGRCLNQHYNN